MISVVIIEDEAPARRKIKRFLSQLEENIEVLAEIDSVSQAITYFSNTSDKIDLILSDIELIDGNAFEIYTKVDIKCPVIFTTAYDSFLMDAFETNGIEYLLKPFSLERFNKAWDKFKKLLLNSGEDQLMRRINDLVNSKINVTPAYKTRFAVSKKSETYFIEIDDIIYFEAEEGLIFAYDKRGIKHILPVRTLVELEVSLNPDLFFKINRAEVVQKKYINKISSRSKNSVYVHIEAISQPLVTSQSNTARFREWITI